MTIFPRTKWQHITFTMPDKLWDFFWYNRHLFNMISPIAAGVIQELAKKQNLQVGIFTAIHTFGRDLKRNVHIHLSVTCGGLDENLKWRKIFFKERGIKRMWRYRIIKLFRDQFKNNNLILTPEYNNEMLFKKLMQDLYNLNWYVNMQESSNNHVRNIEYLSRYLKKPPISEARIEYYDGLCIKFKYLDHRTKSFEIFTIPILNFIERLIRHIPDKHFRSIRYYGFLSNRTRSKLLPLVYTAIKQAAPAVVKQTITWRELIYKTFGIDPLLCPNCKIEMKLSSISHGLSPPILLFNAYKIISRL